MKSSSQTQRERAEAKYAVSLAHRNFGDRAFRVDTQGRHYAPLRAAERRGWVRWLAVDRCALTKEGVSVGVEYAMGRTS